MAPRRDAGEEAKRLRRLHRGGGVSGPGEDHLAGEARHPRRLQRGAAGWSGDGATSGSLRRGAPGGGGHGHAALSPIHGGGRPGEGIRLPPPSRGGSPPSGPFSPPPPQTREKLFPPPRSHPAPPPTGGPPPPPPSFP